MFKPELLKNKFYGLLFILLGFVSIWACDNDATFFVFALMMGLGIFFDKKPLDEYECDYDEYDWEEDYE